MISGATRYLSLLLAANLVWEIAQLPLYTLWAEGTRAEIVFAVLHCTGGDAMIAAVALGIALVLTRARGWPAERRLAVTLAATTIGAGHTVFSEWLNVDIRGSWAYAPAMPRLPPLGTGLAPLLQWLALPPLAMLMVRRAAPGTTGQGSSSA